MQIAFDLGQSEAHLSVRNRLLRLYEPMFYDGLPGPTDQFIHAILGASDAAGHAAFVNLKRHYDSTAALAGADPTEVEQHIAGVEFADRKAADIVVALRRLKAISGDFRLDFLDDWSTAAALRYLEAFHGVGREIAAATVNFSTLRKPALVVDAPVLRALARLGFIPAHVKSAQTAYDIVMPSLAEWPAEDLFQLHWLLKQLGQEICQALRTQCRACPLETLCPKRGVRTFH